MKFLSPSHRRAKREREEFDRAHEQAKHSSQAMKDLLLRGRAEGFAHPWVLSEDGLFRDTFRRYAQFLQSDRNVHSSLIPHFENVDELMLGVLQRFADPAVAMTRETFGGEVSKILQAYERLAELNLEAWEQDSQDQNVAGSVEFLLADAEATVRGPRIKA